MISILAINLALILFVMELLWLYAQKIQDVSFIDAVWPLGMVILTAATSAQMWAGDAGANSMTTHLILALVALWGIRLSLHLFVRWRKAGADKRYTGLIKHWRKGGQSFAMVTLTRVFLLQALLLYFVCLPAQIGIVTAPAAALTPLQICGAALALFGIAFESIGDWQLARFKAKAPPGAVMETGLWRYTRHPNYFGDACTWWGIWLVAAAVSWPAALTIVAPLFLTWTLTRWSGAPMLEAAMLKSRPGYADYIKRTSAFFPWPPKVG